MAGQVVVGGASSGAIRVVCAWCGALLRASTNANALTSHGMCAGCAEQLARVEEASDVVEMHLRPAHH